ncbi:protein jag [Ruania halotolerans]|uniref:Jag family protein n=1 Tax=Ruania halotolerans TaxID=2897773 RepID=UPI001E33D2F5|nr:R3H domain-containing nucleic acid-binding protein [Ruania halotolerans]UFU06532.1 single-stranded DNA-binding protein [Ruania halotolerans]
MTNDTTAPEESELPSTNAVLEEEGEIAADYLEELLDIADLDGDIDIDVDHGRAAVAIVTEEDPAALRALVGKKGEVLDALQELSRLAVQAKTGNRSRLMLDVGGYRKQRKQELTAIAQEAIESVKSSGSSVALAAMNPFERKIVHDAVADAGLISDSEGVEPNRHVVVRAGD